MKWEHTVSDGLKVGQRVDRFLHQRISACSRARLQTLIEENRVTVNERRVRCSYRLHLGDRIRVEFPADRGVSELVPEPVEIPLLFEDRWLLVVNKPPGLLVHPTEAGERHTLVAGLLAHCGSLAGVGGPWRPGIVHRLDRETSGTLVVAKTDATQLALAAQFRKRVVRKVYLALVQGVPSRPEGIVATKLARHPRDGTRMVVASSGREAVTHYRTRRGWNARWTLLEVSLRTGRTHQIRVHCRYLGCPIVGDRVYGKTLGNAEIRAERTMLHAWRLGFFHPFRRIWMEFRAPLPNDMKDILVQLGGDSAQ